MGLEVKAPLGMAQQVAVLNLGHRCACCGFNPKLAKGRGFTGAQARDLLKAHLLHLLGRRQGAHHGQGTGQQRQGLGMGVVIQSLGEQQQIEIGRKRKGAGQLPLEKPGPGGKDQRTAEPGVHQHPQSRPVQ